MAWQACKTASCVILVGVLRMKYGYIPAVEVEMKRAVLSLTLALAAVAVFGQANVPAIVVSSFQTRG